MDILLGILYLPFTLFCFLSGMAIEGVLTQSAPAAIFAAYAIGYTGPAVAFLTYPCLILSLFLRRKGKIKLSNWLRFAPPIVFFAVWGLCTVVEWLF